MCPETHKARGRVTGDVTGGPGHRPGVPWGDPTVTTLPPVIPAAPRGERNSRQYRLVTTKTYGVGQSCSLPRTHREAVADYQGPTSTPSQGVFVQTCAARSATAAIAVRSPVDELHFLPSAGAGLRRAARGFPASCREKSLIAAMRTSCSLRAQ